MQIEKGGTDAMPTARASVLVFAFNRASTGATPADESLVYAGLTTDQLQTFTRQLTPDSAAGPVGGITH
jgi:hypothetical protein